MPQVINTNVLSLNAQRNLNTSGGQLATSLQRLSSGLRINSAKDDAAGLAISNRMTAQIRGLNQAARNANDGISLAQTAEGDLGAITNGLQRIRELAVQSANATNSATDRQALQAEAAQLIAEIERISVSSSFNGVNLLDGSFTSQQFQVGANANQTINVAAIASSRSADIGQTNSASVTAANVVANSLSTGDLEINGNAVAATARDAAAIAAAISDSGANVSATASNTSSVAFGAVTSATVATATTLDTSTSTLTAGTSDAANAVQSISTVSGAFTDAVSNANGQQFSIVVDGVTLIDVTQAGGVAETINDTRLDAALTAQTTALNTAGITFTGTFGADNVQFIRTDGADFNITVASDFNTPGAFAGASFATSTNAVNNGSAAVTDNDFTLELDGVQILNVTGGVGATVDATDISNAITTFANNTAGYSVTGTTYGTDLVLTRDDGVDTTLTITSNFNSGATGTAVQLDGASTETSTNGVTIGEAVAPTYSLSIDGVALDLSTDGADGQITLAEAAGLINDLSGYSAVVNGGNIDVTKDDGSNIVVTDSGADSDGAEGLAGGAAGAGTSTTYYGTVSVTSTGADLVIGGANADRAGFSVAQQTTTAAALTGTTVAATDISTVSGANDAIVSIDAALDQINSARGDLGAIQSRFESVVSSLSTTAENLSAARSRIQDADFASETAALTKGQILQQAGISILSQANSQPQLVLSLLQ